jgi:hypothetical protein
MERTFSQITKANFSKSYLARTQTHTKHESKSGCRVT